LGGPVAAFVAAVYAGIGASALHARVARRHVDGAYSAMLDAIDAAVGDLRAGLVPAAMPATGDAAVPATGDVAIGRAVARIEAAYRISEALGTPLADLLDRVDADLRAGQQLRLNVRAQAAGAQATAVVLAGLPVIGLGVGAGMGVDPLGRLLHTPVGAACAITAVLLQCGGLAWTARLVRGATAGVR
jgi:tight adherence protein B